MKTSSSRRSSTRSVNNILEGAASVGTLDGTSKSGSILSGSGPLTGTASLHNSKLSINSQGSQQSTGSQKPIQESAEPVEPTFLEKAKFYTSLCLGELLLGSYRRLLIDPFFVFRNDSDSLGICFPVPNSLCCGSRNFDDSSRL